MKHYSNVWHFSQPQGGHPPGFAMAAVCAGAQPCAGALPEPGGEGVAAEPPGHAAQAVRGAQPAPGRLVGCALASPNAPVSHLLTSACCAV